MDTVELDELLSQDSETARYHIGTYSFDTVPDLPNNSTCIVNTDNSFGSGEHWCVYTHFSGRLNFFDSYGNSPSYFKGMPSVVDDYNKKRVQSDDTIVCGQWCIYYIFNAARGRSMREILARFTDDFHANDHFVACFVNYEFGYDCTTVHLFNSE